jgi:hypothetical protein
MESGKDTYTDPQIRALDRDRLANELSSSATPVSIASWLVHSSMRHLMIILICYGCSVLGMLHRQPLGSFMHACAIY